MPVLPPNQPHAPILGLTRRLLGRFHVTGVFWYHFPYYAFTRLPAWVERPSAVFFCGFFFLAIPRIRGAITSNLDAVLGRCGLLQRWQRAFRTMKQFAGCLVDRYRFFARPGLFKVVVEGEESWRALMKSGKGIVVVTAHIGVWETAAQLGATLEKRRIHVVREKELDPRAQEFTRQILAGRGEHYVTHFLGEDPALSLRLVEALERGEIVALQGDRPRAGGRAITATLFGRPMLLPVGPAILARSAGVPLVPIFNFRDGRYSLRTVIRPTIHVACSKDREADVVGAVHRIASEIEWAIRERPHQWFCFRHLWPRSENA